MQLKETQTELSFIKDSYYKTAEDYDKTQESLIISVRREAELQESLTIAVIYHNIIRNVFSFS